MQAQTNDEKLATAKKILAEAYELYEQGTADSYRAAYKKYRAAADLFATVADKRSQANSLGWAGYVSNLFGEKGIALESLNQALQLYRFLTDKGAEASTLNNIARIYDDLGDKQKAIDYFNQSLVLYRSVNDKWGEALTLAGIGKVYINLDKSASRSKVSERWHKTKALNL